MSNQKTELKNAVLKSNLKTKVEYSTDSQTLVCSKKRTLIDADTGENLHVDQIIKRVYGQKQFWKVYLMDFLSVLGIIESKQLDVFVYIAENTDQSTNLFIGTYKKIADELQVSQTTIAKIMKKLQKNQFIKKVQNGLWLVNPNIMMKGNDHKRQILISVYNDESQIADPSLEIKRLPNAKELKPESADFEEQMVLISEDDNE